MDEFNSSFFNKVWKILGADVIRAMKEFFETSRLLKQFNSTTLTVVPKT